MTRSGLGLLLCILSLGTLAQDVHVISGKITEANHGKPVQNVTVHVKGSGYSTLSKGDGSFRLVAGEWHDSLEVTSIGYATVTSALRQGYTTNLAVTMHNKAGELQEVVVGIAQKAGRPFMQKVLDHKAGNNPSRFKNYSYQRYSRNELDISNIDFQKAKGNGMKSLMLNTYAGLDSNARNDKELPVYFSETIADDFHSVSPHLDLENIIAKKNLGFKTDMLLGKLEKFYFQFNIYDDWIPVFDQSYVSPLHSNAFAYYKYFEGDSMVFNGVTTLQIRFTPLRQYEKAFSGTMWINTATLAVESVDMHLNKTANLNYVQDISYSEDYKQVYDSSTGQMVYMPTKWTSEIKFESGASLLGLPASKNKKNLELLFRNTTASSKINVNVSDAAALMRNFSPKQSLTDWDQPDSFWQQNRSDSLTLHEVNILKMADSLKTNRQFQARVKLMAIADTGYWDFGNKLRTGSYFSLLSHNQLEGQVYQPAFQVLPWWCFTG